MDCFWPVHARHSHRAAERAPRTPAQPTFVNHRELGLLISEGATFVCFFLPCCPCLGSTTVASSGDQGPLACKMGKGWASCLDTVWGLLGDLAGGPGLPIKTQTKALPGAAMKMLRGHAVVTEPYVLVPPLAGLQPGRGSHAHLHTHVHARTRQGMLPFRSVATDPELTHLRLFLRKTVQVSQGQIAHRPERVMSCPRSHSSPAWATSTSSCGSLSM